MATVEVTVAVLEPAELSVAELELEASNRRTTACLTRDGSALENKRRAFVHR